MADFLKVNSQEYPVEVIYKYKDQTWDNRETKTLHLTMTATEVAALLPTGTRWSIISRDVATEYDDDGQPTEKVEESIIEQDNSDYSLSGTITDYRDDTVSIKMGKPTKAESATASISVLAGEPITLTRAMELRPIIEQATESLSDSAAASVPELVATWAYPVNYKEGDRRSYNGKVYKVRAGQNHTSQADWTPDKTPNLWSIIDTEHTGTQENPIPAERGMEYEYGKYYLDNEDGKVYLCERAGEQAGNKITLHYLPHELIGNYFTIAQTN